MTSKDLQEAADNYAKALLYEVAHVSEHNTNRLFGSPYSDNRFIPIIGLGASFSAHSPPISAEKLLSYLLSPDRLEEVLGDFEQHFLFLVNRPGHGISNARRWYW